jgi:hypothetical protein
VTSAVPNPRPRRVKRSLLELALVLLLLVLLTRPDSVKELGITLVAATVELAIITEIYRRAERRWRPGRALLVTGVATALSSALLTLLASTQLSAAASHDSLLALALGGAIIGELVLGLYVLIVRHPRALEETHALRLESELVALRARLEPHFLLNTLNAIAGLLGENPAQARRALAALGDLLAEALDRAPDRVHTLEAEITWLQAYVVIFEARYGEQLVVTWDIAPGIGSIRVPRLLLQPLVENAMIHGIAASGAGTLALTVHGDKTTVVITIANSGPAVHEADVVAGHGLALVRRRLTLELPNAHLQIAPGSTGGTVAIVTIPLAHRLV